MRSLLPILLLAMLAGCQRNWPAAANGMWVQAAISAPASKAAPVPAVTVEPFTFDEKTQLLEFHYAWPTEVAAIPGLSAHFTNAMSDWKARLLASAAKDKSYRDTNGFPFNPYTGSMDWTAAAQSGRLLSLSGKLDEYTGGAHGNHATVALLWDRLMASEIRFAGLFTHAGAPKTLLHDRWCKALDAERAAKRGANVSDFAEFNRCPALSELAIVPTDADRDGRIDQVTLIADPYVAGPYAEGNYQVPLPVTPAFIAALKPEYRASFEVQPQ